MTVDVEKAFDSINYSLLLCVDTTDDTTFLLRNEKSALELINIFGTFSLFSDLKINKEKCEIAGVKVALCGVEFIWKEKNPKIKYITLCNKYENGGIKYVGAFQKLSVYNALG